MREIKFRAWDSDDKEMVYFDPENYAYKQGNEKLGEFLCDVFGCELQQYTGLKDKNGKEIYEGDLLSSKKLHGAHVLVQFDHHLASWMLKTRVPEDYYGLSFYNKQEHEVIGNIWENPELTQERD